MFRDLNLICIFPHELWNLGLQTPVIESHGFRDMTQAAQQEGRVRQTKHLRWRHREVLECWRDGSLVYAAVWVVKTKRGCDVPSVRVTSLPVAGVLHAPPQYDTSKTSY